MQKDDLVFDADGPPAGEQVTGRGRTSVFFWRRGGVFFLRLIVYLPGLAVGLCSGHARASRGDPRTVRNGWSPSFNPLAGVDTD